MTLAIDSVADGLHKAPRPPTPIVALDVPTVEAALALVNALPAASFFKVGLQLYTVAGPDVVRTLKDRGHRVFLDLKFHDIPNTVAGAVRSAGVLGVDLLTIHASGGLNMMKAATEAGLTTPHRPLIFAVSVLTSMTAENLADVWGRESTAPDEEVLRLSRMAASAGVDGLVASVRDIATVRRAGSSRLMYLTPGIRLAGDAAGDQSRVATPLEAANAAVDYVVIGRTVTAAVDPAAAFARVVDELSGSRFAGDTPPP